MNLKKTLNKEIYSKINLKTLVLLWILFLSPVFASDKIRVMALDNFSTINPSKTFSAQVIEDGAIDGVPVVRGDILDCSLLKVTDPTRAKRDASIIFDVVQYKDNSGVHKFSDDYVAKYAKKVLNKEEIKKTPPREVAKKTASLVGGYFVKGFSYGVSFVDGVAKNDEGNRLKSGAKQVYDDSFLSLVEKGEEIEIQKGDTFYFVVKKKKDAKDDEETEVEINNETKIEPEIEKEPQTDKKQDSLEETQTRE